MSKNKHISYQSAVGWIDISVPPEMEAEFRKMVQRATSTWQDMSPEMRDFADRVLGVEDIMGQNMKEGHSSNVVHSIAYSIYDGHKSVAVTHPEGKPASAIRTCCDTFLTEPHNTKCVESKFHHPMCSGHPETCVCPQLLQS